MKHSKKTTRKICELYLKIREKVEFLFNYAINSETMVAMKYYKIPSFPN